MQRVKHRKPPSLHLHTSSRESSPRSSSAISDWDADDEGFMSSGDCLPSRPLSLVIPPGFCHRRPTLQDVLSNSAPQPFTLSAFMAYLSQKRCLETLEFTIDAKKYTELYREITTRDPTSPRSPQSPDHEYVRMLWIKLLDAYIVPNGPREVNLPSHVRDRLVSLPCSSTPPDPAALDEAVKIIYELMDESVLVPFLNSVAPARPADATPYPWASDDSNMDTQMTGTLEEWSMSPKSRRQRHDSPPIGDTGSDTASDSGASPRLSQPPHLSTSLIRGSHTSAHLNPSPGASSAESPEGLTDDSTESLTPSATGKEPMTPPSTPPTSHVAFAETSPGTSPNTNTNLNQNEGSSAWKKMGAKFGFKRSRSAHSSTSSIRSNSPYHAGRATSPANGNGL
ncbi:Regulator of G-protein signaling, RGS [Venustampulla echinocandica]|uniref:Regulator of G-protein signaling, RGS n=1 Tax=Venustampulla echinocandica TaxID=2656787 RepID=A0A370TQF4_9HELO|nr:Regulator of G-protein signaling, RGS [Venustampulla echinocandica]RDL37765.1 Regulator of G-protein signaling, RGS [Venustampulla echinocandica]